MISTFEEMQVAALAAVAQAEIRSFKAAVDFWVAAVHPGCNMALHLRQLQDMRLFEATMYGLIRQVAIGLPDDDASRDTMVKLAQMADFSYQQIFQVVTGIEAVTTESRDMERILCEALE